MEKILQAGVIGCDMTEEFFQASKRNPIENYNWKKIYAGSKAINNASKQFPYAEIVSDINPIVQDTDISIVFVAADHLELVAPVIEAAKSVRLV